MNAGLNSPVANLENDPPVQRYETDHLLSINNGSSEKSQPRLWPIAYVCMIAAQCFFILGLTTGFSSPVLSELSDKQDRYKSLGRKINQDLFNVSSYS